MRGRLYAAWLGAHGVLAFLPATMDGRLGWPPFNPWVMHLDANRDGTPADTYTVALWGLVAALAFAQAVRPAALPRWLWLTGWLSTGMIASAIAVEERVDMKWRLGLGIEWLEPIPPVALWLVTIAPALAAPLALSGYILYTSVRRHALLAILTAIAAVAMITGLVSDMTLLFEWTHYIEDALEIMAAALLCVVFVELFAQHRCAVTNAAKRIE